MKWPVCTPKKLWIEFDGLGGVTALAIRISVDNVASSGMIMNVSDDTVSDIPHQRLVVF